MAQNKLKDLNNHLFAQIERLTDEQETEKKEDLKMEIDRSKALVELSSEIVDVHRIVLDAAQLTHKMGVGADALPETFGIEPKKLGINKDSLEKTKIDWDKL